MSVSPDGPATPATGPRRRTKSRGWYLLLLPPFVALLNPGFYARETPKFEGIPFFYWYQFLWIVITAVLTVLVYFLSTEPDVGPEQGERGGPARRGGGR